MKLLASAPGSCPPEFSHHPSIHPSTPPPRHSHSPLLPLLPPASPPSPYALLGAKKEGQEYTGRVKDHKTLIRGMPATSGAASEASLSRQCATHCMTRRSSIHPTLPQFPCPLLPAQCTCTEGSRRPGAGSVPPTATGKASAPSPTPPHTVLALMAPPPLPPSLYRPTGHGGWLGWETASVGAFTYRTQLVVTGLDVGSHGLPH